jgi:MOSC domain-containing protein YiiM
MTSPDPAAGRIAAIHLCRGPRVPMGAPQSVEALRDGGLEGDRHGKKGGRRQVLLMDAAVLAAEGLAPGLLRENLTVEGIPVDALPEGARLRVGDAAVLRVTGPCEPCAFVEGIRPGLRARMEGRRGTLAVVEAGGTLRVGDPVEIL